MAVLVLAAVAARFAESGADAVYGDLLYVQAEDPSQVVRRWVSAPYQPRAFFRGWHPPHTALFVRLDAIRHGREPVKP